MGTSLVVGGRTRGTPAQVAPRRPSPPAVPAPGGSRSRRPGGGAARVTMAPWRTPLPRPACCCATCAPAGPAAAPISSRSPARRRNTVSARVDQLIAANLLEEGGRGLEHRRPAADPAAVQQPGRVRARRRPRASPASTSRSPTCPRRSWRPSATPSTSPTGPRRGARRGRPAGAAGARRGGADAGRRLRGRRRRARSGRVLDRAAVAPADHAGLARLPDPQRVRAVRVPGLRRQRRQRHGAGRDGHRRLGAGRARRQGGHRHRLRDHRRRAGLPRGAGQRRGHRAHLRRRSPPGRTVVCRCGNENCLEAIAGGGALLRDAVAAGLPVGTTRELVELAAQGDGPALELVRNAGRTIGTVLAGAGQLLQPAPHRHDRRASRRPACRCWPASARRSTAARCRWPPGRWRSPSARPRICPAGSAPR